MIKSANAPLCSRRARLFKQCKRKYFSALGSGDTVVTPTEDPKNLETLEVGNSKPREAYEDQLPGATAITPDIFDSSRRTSGRY